MTKRSVASKKLWKIGAKEYNTQYVWLSGIVLILLLTYPQLTDYNAHLRNLLLAILLPLLLLGYVTVRYLKKSGRMQE